MAVPSRVEELVERFGRDLALYKRADYKEARVRVEFIDPFFEALGWDVRNVQGAREHAKDVIHEDAITVAGKTRAPDYSFRVGGARKFFLEAKKPSVSLKGDVGPAFQLRRYSWSVKLPLGILTDFEELAVYDCRQCPQAADKAGVGRLMYLTFDQYPDRFDEIRSLFAKESVQQGSLDQYAQAIKGKRGTSEVDAELLKEIEGWRDALARNIALRNQDLSVHELNFCVQRTIDRIIFLRMAEDRGIEVYGGLRDLAAPTQPPPSHGGGEGGGIYSRLGALYRQADAKYDAGIFDFQADTLTPGLVIDDKVLKPILVDLYYPRCPYEFSVLPVEILGQVYEQFLGKVIRLTPSHRAKVEEKPEVKKAGGVYYTPSYIVDYIVRQTVGKLVEGKTPRQVGRLRILDPACGSGSFLLGAYQYLLDYHLRWYEANDPAKHARRKQPAVYQAPTQPPPSYGGDAPTRPPPSYGGDAPTRPPPSYGGGEGGGSWRLTTFEKKRILLNNIYGVDIDRQAVEVTKLSLLLKVLEGETEETLGQQLSLWRERALPDLGDNIKCGNSLIGPDYFEAQLMPDEAEMRRVNPFDWQVEFPQVFAPSQPSPAGEGGQSKGTLPRATGEGRGGGFDVVIGNPPYIRIQTMKEWAPTEVEFYKQAYRAASKGNYDIYVVFVERALQLLNERGRMGYILPHKFFQAKYGQPLRELIAGGKHLAEVVHFGDQQVFAGASTYTCLLFLDKKGNKGFRYIKAHDLDAWRTRGEAVEGEVHADKVTEKEWNFVVGPGAPLFERLGAMPVRLGDVAHLFVGLQTDADDVYILEEVKCEREVVYCKSKASGQIHAFENSHLKHFAKGSLNIRRYRLSDLNKRLVFPYEMREGNSVLLSPQEYQERFPLTWAYLQTNKVRLSARGQGRLSKAEWFGYVYKKNHTRFGLPKLLVPSIATGSCFAADLEGEFYFVGSGGGGGGGYGISIFPDVNLSFHYLLGILNSQVLSVFLKQISTPFRGGYIALNRQYIEQLPIRTIDFHDPADVARHDKMVALVERMLELHRKLATASIPADKTLYRRQIEATDKQIDALVYELYDLTEDEIAIVEEATAK